MIDENKLLKEIYELQNCAETEEQMATLILVYKVIESQPILNNRNKRGTINSRV